MDSMPGSTMDCVVPDWCSTYPPEMAKEKPECQCPESMHPMPGSMMDSMPGSTMDSMPGSTTVDEFNSDNSTTVDEFNSDNSTTVDEFNSDNSTTVDEFNSDNSTTVDEFNSDNSTTVDEFNSDNATAVPEPEPEDYHYEKIANRAVYMHGASGACDERLYYGNVSGGIQRCEEQCNQCADCKGFVDNRDASPAYCVFKSSSNVYEKSSKDWYGKQ
jgi:hypothetical protein